LPVADVSEQASLYLYFARPRLRFSSGRFLPIAALLKQLRS